MPRRSGAPTGGTGRAAASRHIVAAGAPAYAAACQGRGGPAELLGPLGHTRAIKIAVSQPLHHKVAALAVNSGVMETMALI